MTEDKRIRVLSPPQYVKAHDDHMSLAEISTALVDYEDRDGVMAVLADYVRERGERIPNEQL